MMMMMMKLLLCVICVLISEQSFVTSGIEVKGYKSQSVTVECSHAWAVSNRKYFCRNPCKVDKDVVVDSVQPAPEKYQLQDRGNIFTVTITDLKLSDSGSYWCAVDRTLMDTYSEVILIVLDAPPPPPPSSPRTRGTRIYSPTTVSYLGKTSITSNAPSITVRLATNPSTDNNNNNNNKDWRVYLCVSVGVLLLTSLVGILVFLALYYKKSLVNLQCCPGRTEVSHNPHPACTYTPTIYENVLSVIDVSSSHNVFTLQSD